MKRCVALSRKCVNEKAGKSNDIPPYVAAIIVRDGEIIDEAYRGELAPGDHAEFTLLEKKLAGIDVEGATLFTTLEPCVRRSPNKTPCAKWIIERKLGKVVSGILDRNPTIKGDGCCQIQDAGIKISLFDSDIADEIIKINHGFLNSFRRRTKAELQDPVSIGEVGVYYGENERSLRLNLNTDYART